MQDMKRKDSSSRADKTSQQISGFADEISEIRWGKTTSFMPLIHKPSWRLKAHAQQTNRSQSLGEDGSKARAFTSSVKRSTGPSSSDRNGIASLSAAICKREQRFSHTHAVQHLKRLPLRFPLKLKVRFRVEVFLRKRGDFQLIEIGQLLLRPLKILFVIGLKDEGPLGH